jgi:hypothetical protein
MTQHKDMKIKRLQELLDDLVSRKPVQQAIVAVENGDQSFRWVGARGSQIHEETPSLSRALTSYTMQPS